MVAYNNRPPHHETIHENCLAQRVYQRTAMNPQLIQDLLRPVTTPVKGLATRKTAGSPLVASRQSLTAPPMTSSIPEMPSVVRVVREKEIPGVRGRVDHRSRHRSQQMRLWEGRGQGESVLRTLHGDCEEDDQNLNKYIMIPHDRRSAGSSLLAPQASLPRGLVETYSRSPRELAMVPFRRAPGWVRLVDESA